MSTWVVVDVAVAALVGAVSIKFWSAIRLMNRHRVEDYLAIPEARRLYWAGKKGIMKLVELFLRAVWEFWASLQENYPVPRPKAKGKVPRADELSYRP